MAYAVTDDNVKLYYEETGSGVPVMFVHEFAGDHRSWEPQVRHFGKRYRAITFAARGFAPSDVPADASSYSQARAADDIASVLDHLAIPAAHIVGRPCISGFVTRSLRSRFASADVATAPSPTSRPDSRTRRTSSPPPFKLTVWPRLPSATHTVLHVYSSRIRIRAAFSSSSRCSRSIASPAPPTPNAGSSANGRHCTISSTR
jgi:hypothetical protein